MRNKRSSFWKKGLLLLAVFLLAWYVSAYHYQFLLIQGNSMEPSFHNLQLVVMAKNYEEILTGEVIACKADNLDAVLVKRVVAAPGDRVQITDGMLYVNGVLGQHQRPGMEIAYAGIAEEPILLGAEEYFVLGDNYAYSKDSRYEEINVIQKKDIIGVIL